MNVVDSSAWLEYFSGGKNAGYFAEPLQDSENLIVPSITVYEVFKVLLRESGQDAALQAAAAMQRGNIIELSSQLAMSAARLGHELKLPMADSIIYATAQQSNAIVWTQDIDFEGLERVKYYPKNRS